MKIVDEFLEICRNRETKRAAAFQKTLLTCLSLKQKRRDYKTICAFDISYDKFTKTNYAAVVVMKYPGFDFVENHYLIEKAVFPYIPGLLAFREGPAILKVYKKLKTKPDILLFDGQGIAHPRRMGIAAMIGIMLDRPSIGCAKTCLVGEYEAPALSKGSSSVLYHKNEKIGDVLRTRRNVKPVFVSVGNLIDLESATKIVLDCCAKYRLPEPARAAHKLANEIRMRNQSMIYKN